MNARHALRLAVVLAAARALAACRPPPHIVQQSTLVPVPTVALPPSFEGVAEASVGDSTLVYLRQPELRPNSGAALYLPRTQVEGSVTVFGTRRVRLRLPFLVAPSGGAMAAAPTTLGAPGGAALGFAVGAAMRAGGFGERWNLDLAVDLGLLLVPSVLRDESDPRTDRLRYSGAPLYAFTVAPGYVVTRGVRLFMVATVRNQVSNVEEFVTDDPDPDPKITAYHFYVPFGVGVELRPACGLSITPLLQWPLGGSPVDYGPVLSLSVRGSVPSEPSDDGGPTRRCPFPW